MKKHPVLNLYCNENGTKILFEGRELHITNKYAQHDVLKQKPIMRMVNFMNRQFPVVRIICECYHGMRPDKSFFPVRADFDPSNDHYTNLSWGKQRKKPTLSKSKLTLLNAEFEMGKNSNELAVKYGISPQNINRHKRNYFSKKVKE